VVPGVIGGLGEVDASGMASAQRVVDGDGGRERAADRRRRVQVGGDAEVLRCLCGLRRANRNLQIGKRRVGVYNSVGCGIAHHTVSRAGDEVSALVELEVAGAGELLDPALIDDEEAVAV